MNELDQDIENMNESKKGTDDNWKRPLFIVSISIIIVIVISVIAIYFYNGSQTDEDFILTVMYILWAID